MGELGKTREGGTARREGFQARTWVWAGLFFASGLASLIYQTLWIRVAAFTLGSTAGAMGAVVAIFCLGLALGASWSGTRLTGRSSAKVYGCLELGIALAAGPLLELFFRLPAWIGAGLPSLLQGDLIRLFVVGLVIFPASFLMGATFPQMVRLAQTEASLKRLSVSAVYGINTWGAVLGAFLAGFVFLPRLGVGGTYSVAVALNLMVGALAFGLRGAGDGSEKNASPAAASGFSFWIRQGENFWWGAVAALVGFAALAQEIIWSKYFAILLGANIFGLSAALGLTLAGIAAGGLISHRWRHRFNVANLQIWVGVAGLGLALTAVLLSRTPQWTIALAPFTLGLPLVVVKALLLLAVFFPFAIVTGAILPALIEASSRTLGAAHAKVAHASHLYSWNLWGGIFGALLSGLVFLPHFGSLWSLRLAMLFLLLATLILCRLSNNPNPAEGRRRYKGGLALIFLQALAIGAPKLLDFRQALLTAYWQRAVEPSQISELSQALDPNTETILKIYEGKTGFVSTSVRPKEDQSRYLWLKVGGLNESYFTLLPGSADRAELKQELPRYEALLALLPLTAYSEAKSAFLIGYGGGHTATFLSSLGLDRLVIAELEPKVLEAVWEARGRLAVEGVDGATIVAEDARRVLVSPSIGKFDLILSQPSHSWIAGVANLFTREFFREVDARLSERGVFAQWLNLYNTDPEALRSIVAAFFSVFPEGALFSDRNDSELILLGSRKPVRVDGAALARLVEDPDRLAALSQVPVESPYDLVPYFLMGRPEALEFSKGATINSDRNGYAEFRQSRLVYSARAPHVMESLEKFDRGNFQNYFHLPETNEAELFMAVAESIERRSNNPLRFYRVIKAVPEESLRTADELLRFGKILYRFELYASADRVLTKSLEKNPSAEALNFLLATRLAASDDKGAENALRLYRNVVDAASNCYRLELQAKQGKAPPMDINVASIRKGCGTYGDKVWGGIALQRGDLDGAADNLTRYLNSAPNDPRTLAWLAEIAQRRNKAEDAQRYLQAYAVAKEQENRRIDVLARQHQDNGFGDDADMLRRRKLETATQEELKKDTGNESNRAEENARRGHFSKLIER